MSSAAEARINAITSLRKIVGNEPKEQALVDLLDRCGGDVNTAANAFFDGGLPAAPPPQFGASDAPVPGMPVGASGMPIAQPSTMPVAQPMQPPPDPSLVSVQCPANLRPGDDLQVSTAVGMMRVKVPQGVQPGGNFLVRLPPQGGAGGASRQQPQYPGAAAQPQVVVQQQPRTVVHHVHSSPYTGGYGYGYGYGYDPLFAGTMGFMGGMLIADAMFW